MANRGLKRYTKDEIKFLISCILVKHLDFKRAADLARIIYADVVAPAVDEERKLWEQANQARETDSFN
jgi:hypothetical protein